MLFPSTWKVSGLDPSFINFILPTQRSVLCSLSSDTRIKKMLPHYSTEHSKMHYARFTFEHPRCSDKAQIERVGKKIESPEMAKCKGPSCFWKWLFSWSSRGERKKKKVMGSQTREGYMLSLTESWQQPRAISRERERERFMQIDR